MYQAVEQPHVGVGPEGCLIACKTVTLKITLEVILICQGLDNRPGPQPLIIMEDDQSLHDRPYHPEIFLVGPVLFPADDRNGSFVSLYIVTEEDFSFEFFIQRLKQFHRFPEPSLQRAFRKAFHSKMAVLLHLSVERDVIFILLKQYLVKQAGVGDALATGIDSIGAISTPFCPAGESRVLSLSAYLGQMISLT